MKANLYPGQNTITEHNTHIDYEKDGKCLPNISAIYYVNTNNGYTEFKNGEIVNSVQNRLVSFPTHMSHRAMGQTDKDRRIVLNFNYIGQ